MRLPNAALTGLQFSRAGDDLLITYSGTVTTVLGWFLNTENRLDQIETQSGVVTTADQVDALVASGQSAFSTSMALATANQAEMVLQAMGAATASSAESATEVPETAADADAIVMPAALQSPQTVVAPLAVTAAAAFEGSTSSHVGSLVALMDAAARWSVTNSEASSPIFSSTNEMRSHDVFRDINSGRGNADDAESRSVHGRLGQLIAAAAGFADFGAAGTHGVHGRFDDFESRHHHHSWGANGLRQRV